MTVVTVVKLALRACRTGPGSHGAAAALAAGGSVEEAIHFPYHHGIFVIRIDSGSASGWPGRLGCRPRY